MLKPSVGLHHLCPGLSVVCSGGGGGSFLEQHPHLEQASCNTKRVLSNCEEKNMP